MTAALLTVHVHPLLCARLRDSCSALCETSLQQSHQMPYNRIMAAVSRPSAARVMQKLCSVCYQPAGAHTRQQASKQRVDMRWRVQRPTRLHKPRPCTNKESCPPAAMSCDLLQQQLPSKNTPAHGTNARWTFPEHANKHAANHYTLAGHTHAASHPSVGVHLVPAAAQQHKNTISPGVVRCAPLACIETAQLHCVLSIHKRRQPKLR